MYREKRFGNKAFWLPDEEVGSKYNTTKESNSFDSFLQFKTYSSPMKIQIRVYN